MAIAERDESQWAGSQHGLVCLFFWQWVQCSITIYQKKKKKLSWSAPPCKLLNSKLFKDRDRWPSWFANKNSISRPCSSGSVFTCLPLEEVNSLCWCWNSGSKTTFSHGTCVLGLQRSPTAGPYLDLGEMEPLPWIVVCTALAHVMRHMMINKTSKSKMCTEE